VPGLLNRDTERGVLDRFVGAVRAGEGQDLVVSGEPGAGKTVLLDYLAGRAEGCRMARSSGVQSEMELPYAGLHQLCGPLLGHAERLPGPQHEALLTVFGLSAGPPPGRFLVGLSVLSLLSEVAGEHPLICVIDDEQWLDQASAQVLTFAARRLAVEPVGLVFAAREPGPELAGLPGLVVEGLHERDARALLASALAGPLDAQIRELIVAAAMFAAHLADAGDLREVSRAARAAPAPGHPPRLIDLLLDGLTMVVTDGRGVAAPVLRQAAAAFASADTPVEERLRWTWLAQVPASYLWDFDSVLVITDGASQLARDAGALDQLPIDLQAQAQIATWSGDIPAAAALITEARVIAEATGTRIAPLAAMSLAALRGRAIEAAPLIEAALAAATTGGQGIAMSWARWATAILCNGMGRYAAAQAAAGQASQDMPELFVSTFALPELVEAAARTGNTELAASAVEQLAEATRPAGSDWGLGIEARCRALARWMIPGDTWAR
jgi:hypothetical protein